jgi:asparagine synthase (glutamine-hydrolysing)
MLNGIFAVAIWDRERRELFLARDALGVKPLYFSASARGFAFASELKALILALEQRTLDPASLHRYLSFLWCPAKVPHFAKCVSWHQARRWSCVTPHRKKWTWYGPAAFSCAPLSEGEIIASTVRLLRRPYRQLVADVPVGAFLSGVGFDSKRRRCVRARARSGPLLYDRAGGANDQVR